MRLNDILLTRMVTQLVDLCKQELQLDELPEIKIITKSSTVADGSSFGLFDGAIHVVAKDRHPLDVMRTLAHELVHWKQRCRGDKLDGNDGSETENQANAVAGEIMRKFGKMYPRYFINAED